MNQRKLDDLDFYEKYLLNAGQAERDKYIEEHPDFLNDYPVSYEHRELLQDELYRKLLRRIRAYETGERTAAGKSRKKGIKSKIRLKKFFYITSLTLFGKYNLR